MKKKEILEFLLERDSEPLFSLAQEKTQAVFGRRVFLRGIIEFSNYCQRDCLYCGLRQSNYSLARYRMRKEEIILLSQELIRKGIRTIVLQSGDDFFYSWRDIVRIIEGIKSILPTVALTLSLGERPFSDYREFRQAGADRYLLKHETHNWRLYRFFHPSQTLKQRIKTLDYLRQLGFQVGCGNIVGLPYQSREDLADDILFMQEFQPDMVGIGPFLPANNTPLAEFSPGSGELTFKVLALVRLCLPFVYLPATTALESLMPGVGQRQALEIAANVIMPSFTPLEYERLYSIYNNKAKISLEKAEATVISAGKVISWHRADSLLFSTF